MRSFNNCSSKLCRLPVSFSDVAINLRRACSQVRVFYSTIAFLYMARIKTKYVSSMYDP